MKKYRWKTDASVIRRFNCQYDKTDVDNWKRWIIHVQKPMNCILAASLLSASVVTLLLELYLGMAVQKSQYDFMKIYKSFPKEIFAAQAGILLLMFGMVQTGNYILSRKIPRPRLERCLEVHFHSETFSLFYFYRKKRERILIDTFTYKLVDITPLDDGIILVNGKKIQFGTPSLNSLLKPTEWCKLRKSYGYLKGIRGFSYYSDGKAFLDEVCRYREQQTE